MARKLAAPLALALSALLIFQIVTTSNFLAAYATKNAGINDVEAESSSYNLGDEAVFYVYVKNTGTESLHARIVGNILDPDGNVVYDSHVEGEDESRNIAPGSTSAGRFEWRIPESMEPGDYEIRSSVREWDDWETMYDWSDEGDFEVEELGPPSLENYGVSATSSSIPQEPISVTPGGEFRAHYWIENPNSQDMKVMLGLSIRSPSGEVISDSNDDKQCNLEPDTVTYCTRYFDLPNDLENGDYDVAFGVWDSGMDVQYEQEWANNWLEVNEEYDLTLVTETADGYGIDGELEVSGMGTFDTDPSYTLKVSNGEYVIFAPEKIGDRIFKGWESSGDVDHLDIGDYTTRITVEGDGEIIAIYDDPPFFTLDASPDEITGMAGEKLSTTITISSENGFDDYVEIGVGWPGHLDIADHSDDNEVKVNEDGEATYEAFIILDEGEEEGTYTMSVWAESDDYSDEIDVVFNVLPSEPDEESSFELSVSPASMTVVQGASRTFSIDVDRIGDFDEEVRLTLDDDNADIDWEFDREEDQPPFHTSLTIETTSDTEPGTYEMRIIAAGDDVEIEAELILTVEEAEVIEDIEDVVDAEIESFSLNADEFVEGDEIEAVVEVENTGNTDYTFFVGFSVRNEDSGEWFDANPKSIRFSPDSTRTVTLELRVGSGAPLGEYEAVVAIWLGENGDGSLYGELDRETDAFLISPAEQPEALEGSLVDEEINTVSFSVDGLPPSVSVTVWIDDSPALKLRSNQQEDFEFPVMTTIKVNLDEYVYDGAGIRYYREAQSLYVDAPTSFVFNYKTQYYLDASYFIDGKKYDLEQEGWYDEDSVLELYPPSRSGYEFWGWGVDNQSRDRIPLRLTMDRPHDVVAFLQEGTEGLQPSDTILYAKLERNDDGFVVKYVPLGPGSENLQLLMAKSGDRFIETGKEVLTETVKSEIFWIGVGAGVACSTIPFIPAGPHGAAATGIPKAVACGVFIGLTAYSATSLANQIYNNVKDLASESEGFTLILEGDPDDPEVQKAIDRISDRIGDLGINAVEGVLLVAGGKAATKMTWTHGGRTTENVPTSLTESLAEGRAKGSGQSVEMLIERVSKSNEDSAGSTVKDIVGSIQFQKLVSLVKEAKSKGQQVDAGKAAELYGKWRLEKDFPASEGHKIIPNVKLYDFSRNVVTEIDLLVTKDGKAVKAYQIKYPKDADNFAEAIQQNEIAWRAIHKEPGSRHAEQVSDNLQISQLESLQKGDMLTIGPKDAVPEAGYSIRLDLASLDFERAVTVT